ncbi:sigma factor-like helix-turn-helix DNA-binding protein [Paraclostridium benzoelyticum]|nr:sigma factor-like helix-turn-helix DNA-binding protein [Paraclostridium benzoelyticum]
MTIRELQDNCFRFTEKILYNYAEMGYHIENLEFDIKNLQAGKKVAIRAIRYDDIKTSQTYNISRQVESEVIDMVAYVQDLEIEVYKEKRLKKQIDRAINNLKPIRKQIIELRYLEGMDWTTMSQELHYDEKTLRKYKNEAVKSIAVELFGSKVFKEEEPTLFDMLAI